MKKVVLIRPKSPASFWQLEGVHEYTRKKATIPPLGLATIGALTPPEFHVRIVDEEVEAIDFDIDCDLVAVTGYTLHRRRMLEIADEFRKRGVLTAGGGPFCTSHAEICREHFDVLFCGEAEMTWPAFLDDWRGGRHESLYRQEGQVDMTASPAPRWELLDAKSYSAGMVQTSRGCPYDCEFCDVVSLFGRQSRHKTVDQVMGEVQRLVSMGWFDIFFADDNFIGDRAFAKELLRRLIDLNRSLRRPNRYLTQVTLNVATDEELLDLFKEANFYSFFIGIETPKKESLIAANKRHNAAIDMAEAVRSIQSRGIFVVGGMIVGFDTDDPGIFPAMKTFLADAGLTLPQLGMLAAWQGTKLWDRLSREGRILPELEDGDMFNRANFIPKLMSREELEREYASLLAEVYDYPHFIRSFENLVGQIDPRKARKNSPLAAQMKLGNFRLYFLGVSWRVLRGYLFSPSREERRLLRRAVSITLKKGLIAVPWLIEQLLYFKVWKDFVDRHAVSSLQGERGSGSGTGRSRSAAPVAAGSGH